MASVEALTRRIDNLLALIEQQQQIPDWQMSEKLHAYILEGITRKLAIYHHDKSLTDEQRAVQFKLIDQDIESRMSPAERAARDRFNRRHAGDIAGAKERLIERLKAIRDTQEGRDVA